MLSCTTPHLAEVVGTARMRERPWPGVDRAEDEAAALCGRPWRNAEKAANASDELVSYYVHPPEERWAADVRTVVCLEVSASKPIEHPLTS